MSQVFVAESHNFVEEQQAAGSGLVATSSKNLIHKDVYVIKFVDLYEKMISENTRL